MNVTHQAAGGIAAELTPQVNTDLLQLTDAEAARFWAKVNKNGPVPTHRPELGSCWIWTGFQSKQGYGHVLFRGAVRLAHRVSWSSNFNHNPGQLKVCHHCDNPSCVNPSHLWLGTQKENVQDSVRKGRAKRATAIEGNHGSITRPESVPCGKRSGRYTKPWKTARGDRHGCKTKPETIPRGEKNGSAKLTDDKVRKLRDRFAAGGITKAALGAEFGVSSVLTGLIVRRKIWKHVT